MAIYDFDGHESTGPDNTDYTGKWRYIEGLPFSGTQLQNAIVSFDKYLVVFGEDHQKDKVVYYFDVEAENWFDKNGELDPTSYQPPPPTTTTTTTTLAPIVGNLREY